MGNDWSPDPPSVIDDIQFENDIAGNSQTQTVIKNPRLDVNGFSLGSPSVDFMETAQRLGEDRRAAAQPECLAASRTHFESACSNFSVDKIVQIEALWAFTDAGESWRLEN
jgi:hypothetical protein